LEFDPPQPLSKTPRAKRAMITDVRISVIPALYVVQPRKHLIVGYLGGGGASMHTLVPIHRYLYYTVRK
jgi:hypothetical protein